MFRFSEDQSLQAVLRILFLWVHVSLPHPEHLMDCRAVSMPPRRPGGFPLWGPSWEALSLQNGPSQDLRSLALPVTKSFLSPQQPLLQSCTEAHRITLRLRSQPRKVGLLPADPVEAAAPSTHSSCLGQFSFPSSSFFSFSSFFAWSLGDMG